VYLFAHKIHVHSLRRLIANCFIIPSPTKSVLRNILVNPRALIWIGHLFVYHTCKMVRFTYKYGITIHNKQGQRKAWRIPSPENLTRWPWPLTLKINRVHNTIHSYCRDEKCQCKTQNWEWQKNVQGLAINSGNSMIPKYTINKGNAKRGVSPRLKIWPGDLDLWPWKSIGFQILLKAYSRSDRFFLFIIKVASIRCFILIKSCAHSSIEIHHLNFSSRNMVLILDWWIFTKYCYFSRSKVKVTGSNFWC
jgi:hypothetical protein